MKYCINIKQSKAKQSKAKPKIVSLINNSFKIVLLILLFSISCKSKQKPEEKYNGIIPKGFSGKYILPKNDGSFNYNDYFETTSSNAIIGSPKVIRQGVIPIVLKDSNFSHNDSINGKSIMYFEDYLGKNPEFSFIFFTNKDSKRTLIFQSLLSGGWRRECIHADD